MIEQEYKFVDIEIAGTKLIHPFSIKDERGGMIKEYSRELFYDYGITFEPVETLYIASKFGVIRGIHFQKVKEQAKLVRCISGHLWGVVVDLRSESETLGKWCSVDLKPLVEVFVPEGCAFGTLAFEDSTFTCVCGEKFYAEYDDGIRWDDKDLSISWPLEYISNKVILSERDRNLQTYHSYLKSIGKKNI